MVLPGGAATWTVLGPDHGVVGPAEEFLEYLRVQGTSPNTVKSYARALALWWTYLAVFGLAWDALTLADVGGFLLSDAQDVHIGVVQVGLRPGMETPPGGAGRGFGSRGGGVVVSLSPRPR